MSAPIRFDAQVFRNRMHASVRAELDNWKAHPELAKIVSRLDSVSRHDQFLDCFAEYAIARLFVNSGCQLFVEVETQKGKRADFKVSKGGSLLYAHIKRLNPDETHARQEKLEPLFAPLEKIKNPIYVQLHLRPNLTHDQSLIVVKLAAPFILRATIGDEFALSENGVDFGIAHVLGESGSDRAAVWVDFGMQECTDRDRMPKKLSQAYDQFMPDKANIIFLACNWATEYDLTEFENILFGSTWGETIFDSNLMEFRTVRTGRKSDGFWSGEKHPDSQAVCFFRFLLTTGEIEQHKLWVRSGSESQIPDWFNGIF